MVVVAAAAATNDFVLSGAASPVVNGLASAFVIAGRTIEASLFLNVAYVAIGLGIFLGSFVAAWLIGWLLWKCLMCGHGEGWRTAHKNDGDALQAKHIPVSILPVWQPLQPLPKVPSLTRPVLSGEPVLKSRSARAQQQQETATWNQHAVSMEGHSLASPSHWHGHDRSKYENYVRLTILLIRIVIVLAGTVFSFATAGVSFMSLATGLGLIGITFSVGASTFIVNVFSATATYATHKLELDDFIEIGPVCGEITAFYTMYFEVTDDYHPLQGRRVHQIPNRLPVDTIVTIYPNGPPIQLISNFATEQIRAQALMTELYGTVTAV